MTPSLDGSDLVAGAADALHAGGDGGGRLDLDDHVDGTHVDAELERGGGDDGADLSGFEEGFDFGALGGGERAVMGAGEGLLGEVVDEAGEALGGAAVVDEDEGGLTGEDDGEETRRDGGPDGGTFGGLGKVDGRLMVGKSSHVPNPRDMGHPLDSHVPNCRDVGHPGMGYQWGCGGKIFNGNFNFELEAFGFGGVDDGDGAGIGYHSVGRWGGGRAAALLSFGMIHATEKEGDFFEWALGGGEADALERTLDDGFEALEREGEMGAAFGRDEGVDLIDDDGVDGAQGGGSLGGEQQVEGFRGGDEDVGGMAAEAGAFGLRGIAGADGDLGGTKGDASVASEGGDGFERRAEVAFHVDCEGFEGADVEDAALGFSSRSLARRFEEHEAIEAPEKGSEGFAGAGGREDEGGFAARDGGPAQMLRRGGCAERGAEPCTGDGMEERERIGGLGFGGGFLCDHRCGEDKARERRAERRAVRENGALCAYPASPTAGMWGNRLSARSRLVSRWVFARRRWVCTRRFWG